MYILEGTPEHYSKKKKEIKASESSSTAPKKKKENVTIYALKLVGKGSFLFYHNIFFQHCLPFVVPSQKG